MNIDTWYAKLIELAKAQNLEGILADKEEYESSYFADGYTPEDTLSEEISYCDFDATLEEVSNENHG